MRTHSQVEQERARQRLLAEGSGEGGRVEDNMALLPHHNALPAACNSSQQVHTTDPPVAAVPAPSQAAAPNAAPAAPGSESATALPLAVPRSRKRARAATAAANPQPMLPVVAPAYDGAGTIEQPVGHALGEALPLGQGVATSAAKRNKAYTARLAIAEKTITVEDVDGLPLAFVRRLCRQLLLDFGINVSYQRRGGRVAADVRAELIRCWPLNCTSITLAGSPASPV